MLKLSLAYRHSKQIERENTLLADYSSYILSAARDADCVVWFVYFIRFEMFLTGGIKKDVSHNILGPRLLY